jgi:hypothetical protein
MLAPKSAHVETYSLTSTSHPKVVRGVGIPHSREPLTCCVPRCCHPSSPAPVDSAACACPPKWTGLAAVPPNAHRDVRGRLPALSPPKRLWGATSAVWSFRSFLQAGLGGRSALQAALHPRVVRDPRASSAPRSLETPALSSPPEGRGFNASLSTRTALPRLEGGSSALPLRGVARVLLRSPANRSVQWCPLSLPRSDVCPSERVPLAAHGATEGGSELSIRFVRRHRISARPVGF